MLRSPLFATSAKHPLFFHGVNDLVAAAFPTAQCRVHSSFKISEREAICENDRKMAPHLCTPQQPDTQKGAPVRSQILIPTQFQAVQIKIKKNPIDQSDPADSNSARVN